MADGDRETLVEEIGRARERVVELKRAHEAEATRIAELEAEIAALDAFAAESPASTLAEPATSEVPAAQAARRSPDRKLANQSAANTAA